MTLNKIAIIQARMTSTRLPGKVMQDIAGQPMLQHVINRTKQSQLTTSVMVATTTNPSDDVLEQFCQKQNLPCYRGSLPDVLDRFYQAARNFQADVIIRLTADCPLIDPEVIDRTIASFFNLPFSTIPPYSTGLLESNLKVNYTYDFAANRLPPPWQRTLPIGLDVEVCTFEALERAWKEANQQYQREHVMPFLYEGMVFTGRTPGKAEWYIEHGKTPRGFKVALLNHSPDYGALRCTVDTPADLEFVRRVYDLLGRRIDFSWKDVLKLLEQKPELTRINAEVKHKSAFDVEKPTENP
jgi:spore coat polysaccharide biosynthesis protein SpsF